MDVDPLDPRREIVPCGVEHDALEQRAEWHGNCIGTLDGRREPRRRRGGVAVDRGLCTQPTATDQPLPSVEPAFDFAPLLEPLDASVDPAFDSAAFDGFPIVITSLLAGV
ncbi:hypothetical protein [Cellulomonas denverensis]|uniref:hypothetical protein n=1 Tax=Cellulomonas denverensis TaxID=264297 RepID=UPI0035EBC729